ncbi:alkaline phosphatase family protein [Alteribacter natronophilus]|uniref:alkaline phosphatase family protein n=1 Tax=Alteribacter natronophilus TaxID=2583810 RepID=UPI00110E7972|nr:alkaline phosphatase family protein [Alteribacter natronophilus]TMW70660.1 alkaline phosphatase family protein [Alteribacter natronophilus]
MMKKFNVILLVFLFLTSCQQPQGQNMTEPGALASSYDGKNVILIILDSLMGSAVDSAIEKGTIPGMEFLIKNGYYDKELVAPFPSMSVTIESSLITGEPPDRHKVPGLTWYDEDEDRMVNYGTTIEYWVRNGIAEGAWDTLYNLNNTHLSREVTTVFEDLDQRGFKSGSVNILTYRGNSEKELHVPFLAEQVTRLPETITTKAPDLLTFGRIKKAETLEDEPFTDGVFNRGGLVDQNTTEVLTRLMARDSLPDFTLAFLPDNDKRTHKHGPHYIRGIEKADEYIQEMLNTYPSWEEALEDNIFIIIGDHGQDQLHEEEDELAIDLDELYSGYTVAPLGENVTNGDIAFGINQRMTYVYDVHHQGLTETLAEHAVNDQRIALSAWRDGDMITVISPYHEGEFRFKKNGDWTDRYNQRWSVEGNSEIVSIKTDADTKKIKYDEFPDVLNQLHGALYSHPTPKVVLAAVPEHSFKSEGIEMHEGGGEHGGLYKTDTLAAIIIAGTDKRPEHSRISDLKDYILDLFPESSTKGTGD